MKELDGEEAAAQYMSGVFQKDDGTSPAGMPQPNEYKMIKGFTEPSGGIDQIWVKPYNWDPNGEVNPEEIVIVECKGGKGQLSSTPVYQGQKGIDGNAMVYGCGQMTDDWVFVNATEMKDAAQESAEVRKAGEILCNKLGKSSANTVVSNTVVSKKIIQHRLLKTQGKLLEKSVNVAKNTAPTSVASTRTKRNRVQTTTSNGNDAAANAAPNAERITKMLRKDAPNILQTCNTIANDSAKKTDDYVFDRHIKNIIASMESLKASANHQANKSLSANPFFTNDYVTDNPYTQIQSGLNELQGELKAAMYMAAFKEQDPNAQQGTMRSKYKMVKGYTSGGKGFDQIWVAPPDWAPPGTPAEIVIVEAKGAGANLSKTKVDKGEFGRNGTRLGNGCEQMSAEWVYVQASSVSGLAEKAPKIQAAGDLIRQRLKIPPDLSQPPPAIIGMVIKDGEKISTITYP